MYGKETLSSTFGTATPTPSTRPLKRRWNSGRPSHNRRGERCQGTPQREVSSSLHFGGGIRGWTGDKEDKSPVYRGGENLTGEVRMNGMVGVPLSRNSSGGRRAPQSFSGNNVVCYNGQKTGHTKYDCQNLKVKA